jgi:hypothetical protein
VASSPTRLGEPPADATRLPGLLGYRLDRVVELPTGQIIAIVDEVDEVTCAAAESCGAVGMARAAVVAKADGLARAYGESPTPVPPAIAIAVLQDARRLVRGLVG